MGRAALTTVVAVIAGAAAASITVLAATTPLAQQAVPPLSYALADAQVEMHRLGCLGRCPVYTVVLKGDGSGWYDGAKYVEATGKRSFRITRDNVRAVLQALYDARFFAFTETIIRPQQHVVIGTDDRVTITNAEAVILDDEEIRLVVRLGAYSKELMGNRTCFGASGLWEVGRLIDRVTDTKKWSGGS